MLIASCTSYPKRISNLPVVVDSILRNSCPPDKIIINLSRDEFPNCELPKEVQEYINAHKQVSVNWLDGNWKVYKKFLPILKEYQDALIFPFDDDIIYPNNIIEEALEVHRKYPTSPVACNHYQVSGLKAHCGAGSLVMAKHFLGWEEYVNEDMIAKCPADDVFYTQMAAMNGYFYRATPTHFPDCWESYEEGECYSKSIPRINKLTEIALYEVLGQKVKMRFSDDETKPVCVMNILAVPRGLDIEEELLGWVIPAYNVLIVEHNGKKFEYPGLKLAHDYVVNNDIKVPICYIHSKGAWHVRKESYPVRKMWRHEFFKRQKDYLAAVNVDKPMIATPYHGVIHSDWLNIAVPKGITYNIPYENGWVANAAAVRNMDVFLSDNRYIYEILCYKGIEMKGLIMHDIAGEDIPSRKKITEHIMTF